MFIYKIYRCFDRKTWVNNYTFQISKRGEKLKIRVVDTLPAKSTQIWFNLPLITWWQIEPEQPVHPGHVTS